MARVRARLESITAHNEDPAADRTLVAFLDSLADQPVWRGLQVYGFQRTARECGLTAKDIYVPARPLEK